MWFIVALSWIGFIALIAFLALKIFGAVTWPWWYVLLPLGVIILCRIIANILVAQWRGAQAAAFIDTAQRSQQARAAGQSVRPGLVGGVIGEDMIMGAEIVEDSAPESEPEPRRAPEPPPVESEPSSSYDSNDSSDSSGYDD